MRDFQEASELLGLGETALVLFTRGQHFSLGEGGSGSTGKWVLDPDREVDRVVIYNRQSAETTGADLWRGRASFVEPSDRPRRYVIMLTEVEKVGRTELNWREFAGGGTNPVRYVSNTAPSNPPLYGLAC